MSKVNKIDFYCGAFLSYLITNGVEPTLFDASDKSKIVTYTLRNNEYNTYLKYSSQNEQTIIADKTYLKWNFVFTNTEKDIVFHSFKKYGKENIMVLVCTTKDLKETFFGVLSYDEAVKCLGNDSVNKQCRITVKRQKALSSPLCKLSHYIWQTL